MKNTKIEKLVNKLVNAFFENKIINPIPTKYTKSMQEAQLLRRLSKSVYQGKINSLGSVKVKII